MIMQFKDLREVVDIGAFIQINLLSSLDEDLICKTIDLVPERFNPMQVLTIRGIRSAYFDGKLQKVKGIEIFLDDTEIPKEEDGAAYKPINVTLPEETVNDARTYCVERGISMNRFIGETIDNFFNPGEEEE